MNFVALTDIYGDDILINPLEVESLKSHNVMVDGGIINRTIMTMKSGNLYMLSGWPSVIAGKLGASVTW